MNRPLIRRALGWAVLCVPLVVCAMPAHADTLQTVIDQAGTAGSSPILKTFLLLSALSLLPILLIGLTSFTRIIVVLSLVRSAIGLQQTPPNSVLITLALFFTFFTMAPVIQGIQHEALDPYLAHKIDAATAVEQGFEPLKLFMVRQTHASDLRAVLSMAKAPQPATVSDIRAADLIPAFMLSELETAFQIGFVIFLPFLLIDLVVAAVLMGLGMIMVPPGTISLPLKILLFLLINGWTVIAQALLSGYMH